MALVTYNRLGPLLGPSVNMVDPGAVGLLENEGLAGKKSRALYASALQADAAKKNAEKLEPQVMSAISAAQDAIYRVRSALDSARSTAESTDLPLTSLSRFDAVEQQLVDMESTLSDAASGSWAPIENPGQREADLNAAMAKVKAIGGRATALTSQVKSLAQQVQREISAAQARAAADEQRAQAAADAAARKIQQQQDAEDRRIQAEQDRQDRLAAAQTARDNAKLQADLARDAAQAAALAPQPQYPVYGAQPYAPPAPSYQGAAYYADSSYLPPPPPGYGYAPVGAPVAPQAPQYYAPSYPQADTSGYANVNYRDPSQAVAPLPLSMPDLAMQESQAANAFASEYYNFGSGRQQELFGMRGLGAVAPARPAANASALDQFGTFLNQIADPVATITSAAITGRKPVRQPEPEPPSRGIGTGGAGALIGTLAVGGGLAYAGYKILQAMSKPKRGRRRR